MSRPLMTTPSVLRCLRPTSARSLRRASSIQAGIAIPVAPACSVPMSSPSPVAHHPYSPARLRAPFSTTSSPRSPAPSGSAPSLIAQQPAPLTPQQYHKLSDGYIESLLAELEALAEADESGEVDVEYSAGVLNLRLPAGFEAEAEAPHAGGTYVLNKQPPNQQIWLSSPVSGPKRYDYVLPQAQADAVAAEAQKADPEATDRVEGGQWVYLRDGSTLSGLLREELGIKLEDVD